MNCFISTTCSHRIPCVMYYSIICLKCSILDVTQIHPQGFCTVLYTCLLLRTSDINKKGKRGSISMISGSEGQKKTPNNKIYH